VALGGAGVVDLIGLSVIILMTFSIYPLRTLWGLVCVYVCVCMLPAVDAQISASLECVSVC